jgi:hypothetical protein
MRCLYCGKELALLKRLTGGGDFCSDAHKQSYQEEYNRLALSRLLQAQKRGQPASTTSAQSPLPPPRTAVAVEEPAPEQQISPEIVALKNGAADQSTVEVGIEDATVDVETIESDRFVSVEPEHAEPEPVEEAGFLLESPTIATMPEETPEPFVESWLELSAGPAMSEWRPQNQASVFNVSAPDLLALHLVPAGSAIASDAPAFGSPPREWHSTQPNPTFGASTTGKPKRNRLPFGPTISLDAAPVSVAWGADRTSVQGVGFQTTVPYVDSQLLELPPSIIDFVPEDGSVVVLQRSHYNGTGGEHDTPRASLEALSRLHRELAEQEAAHVEPAPPEEERSLEPEVVEVTAQPAVSAPDTVAEEIREPKTIEIVADQSAAEEPIAEEPTADQDTAKPKFTTELFQIPLRTFAPTKAAPVGAVPVPSSTSPLLPHMKALPLRPKVALASSYVPPSIAPAPLESKPAGAQAQQPQNPPKPPPSGKPTQRLAQPKPPVSSLKPEQPKPEQPAAKTAIAKPEVAKPDVAKPEATKTINKPAPSVPIPAKEAVKAQTPPAEKTTTSKSKPEPAKSPGDPAKPAADQIRQARSLPQKDNVPSFEIAQAPDPSWAGSLKLKLGIAILLLVLACSYFLGWGRGKTHSSPNSNSAALTDGAGPSIIMGEGGWVEGWGGDPSGMHGGRQITIYRPSLKLSDYRLEFQGTIDSKSLGWVFRAADPSNYYAMKLMLVSTASPAKVALFKYLVANGRQTQVGRVPIDLPVQLDAVFDIRVDVRGPQFTTYIEGQQVDSWTDDQLKIGGAGFLNEREERGKVKSVSIRYLSGGAK